MQVAPTCRNLSAGRVGGQRTRNMGQAGERDPPSGRRRGASSLAATSRRCPSATRLLQPLCPLLLRHHQAARIGLRLCFSTQPSRVFVCKAAIATAAAVEDMQGVTGKREAVVHDWVAPSCRRRRHRDCHVDPNATSWQQSGDNVASGGGGRRRRQDARHDAYRTPRIPVHPRSPSARSPYSRACSSPFSSEGPAAAA